MLRVIPFRAPFKLALTFVFLTTPLFAHAGGTAAAAAIASAAAAAHSDKEPLVAGQSSALRATCLLTGWAIQVAGWCIARLLWGSSNQKTCSGRRRGRLRKRKIKHAKPVAAAVAA